MVSFSEIAVDCIPLTTAYDTGITTAVMYGMSALLTVDYRNMFSGCLGDFVPPLSGD